MNTKILIVGGHSTPAVATYTKLRNLGYTNFVWVGEKYNQRKNKNTSAEYKTVKEDLDIPFINLNAGKIVRGEGIKGFLKTGVELAKIFLSLFASVYIIATQKPKLILSFGGFTAVPITIVGKFFRIPIVTHEQTIVMGLANKIIARLANVVCISFSESLQYIKNKNKVVLTGNPLRQEIFEIKSNIFSNLNQKLPTIYITGGNQGANEINKRVFEILPSLLNDYNVIHQTGNSTQTNDFVIAEELAKSLVGSNGVYLTQTFFGLTEIGEVLNKSDIILSRAGANTVQEILSLGKMSILLPIPWTSFDEQTKNAKLVEQTGLAIRLVQDKNLTPADLEVAIRKAMDHKSKSIDFFGNNLIDTITRVKNNAPQNAAQKVAEQCVALLNN